LISKSLFLEKGGLLIIVGFLLGRAVVLSVVSPFAVAFLATVWFVHKEKTLKVLLSIMIGAMTYSVTQGVFVTLAMLVFIFLAGMFKKVKNQQLFIPL